MVQLSFINKITIIYVYIYREEMSNYKLHRYKKPKSYELQMMILPTFFVLCNYPLTIPMGYTNH